MGVEVLPKDLKIGLLMLFVGGLISFLKYHFRNIK